MAGAASDAVSSLENKVLPLNYDQISLGMSLIWGVIIPGTAGYMIAVLIARRMRKKDVSSRLEL